MKSENFHPTRITVAVKDNNEFAISEYVYIYMDIITKIRFLIFILDFNNPKLHIEN